MHLFVVFLLGVTTLVRPIQPLDLYNAENARYADFPRRRAGHRLAAEECVFVLATPHSGSTALMDALNQIPNYLIRGENWAAHYNLFNAYQRMSSIPQSPGQSYIHWREHRQASFHTVKSLYEAQAYQRKLPFFHEFQVDRVLIATRAYYKVLFGHYGNGVVAGFKETRYVCGTAFGSNQCSEQFSAYLHFLRRTCIRTKVFLLSRTDNSVHANPDIFEPLTGGQKLLAERDLERTHQLYDDYVRNNPEHAFRVHMEGMFDHKRNATLARNILTFLQEDPFLPIQFTRMPPK
ncbi:hypothetical protein Vafri_5094 [Volvox africanus]|uniref:Sulfotransferase n=2 Tax=Volvox africanus TaxID=51714 RepID=A0A8J4AXT0_9CHLO|nr:hypothetical protein Vafri_5094 [Volvox africanus]